MYCFKNIVINKLKFELNGRENKMDKEQIKVKLLEIVKEELTEIEADDIDIHASFEKAYGMNSINLIQLIVALEPALGVKFDDRELALKKYDSFHDLITILEEKLNK